MLSHLRIGGWLVAGALIHDKSGKSSEKLKKCLVAMLFVVLNVSSFLITQQSVIKNSPGTPSRRPKGIMLG